MEIVGDKMTAEELKEKVLKKPYRDAHIIGHLEACVPGQCDSYYHIHNNEQIPVNIGIFVKLR